MAISKTPFNQCPVVNPPPQLTWEGRWHVGGGGGTVHRCPPPPPLPPSVPPWPGHFRGFAGVPAASLSTLCRRRCGRHGDTPPHPPMPHGRSFVEKALPIALVIPKEDGPFSNVPHLYRRSIGTALCKTALGAGTSARTAISQWPMFVHLSLVTHRLRVMVHLSSRYQ